MNGMVDITIELDLQHCEKLEDIAKTLGKSLNDTLIYMIETELALDEEKFLGIKPEGKEATL